MDTKRIFTPREATQRLPLVKKIVSDILTKAERYRAVMMHVKSDKIPADALALQAQIEALMSELDELGCYYKGWDFKTGLVDFPSLIEGREVLLCWRSDESRIIWYHTWESGYANRKLIPAHLL